MPLRLALDTNRYSDFHRGDATVAALLEQAEEILIPLPVVGELRVGFAGGSRGVENEQVFPSSCRAPASPSFTLISRRPITIQTSSTNSAARALRFP